MWMNALSQMVAVNSSALTWLGVMGALARKDSLSVIMKEIAQVRILLGLLSLNALHACIQTATEQMQ